LVAEACKRHDWVATYLGAWDAVHLRELLARRVSADVVYSCWRSPSGYSSPLSRFDPVPYVAGLDFVGEDVLIRGEAVRKVWSEDLLDLDVAPFLQELALRALRFVAVPVVTYTRGIQNACSECSGESPYHTGYHAAACMDDVG
jgi:hypothetical protein